MIKKGLPKYPNKENTSNREIKISLLGSLNNCISQNMSVCSLPHPPSTFSMAIWAFEVKRVFSSQIHWNKTLEFEINDATFIKVVEYTIEVFKELLEEIERLIYQTYLSWFIQDYSACVDINLIKVQLVVTIIGGCYYPNQVLISTLNELVLKKCHTNLFIMFHDSDLEGVQIPFKDLLIMLKH